MYVQITKCGKKNYAYIQDPNMDSDISDGKDK